MKATMAGRDERVALVIGATDGLGRGVAERLAAAGLTGARDTASG